MADREKVINAFGRCESYGYCEDRDCPYYENTNCLEMLRKDALELLKEQDHVPQKMWNALYTEEDRLEKKFVGTDEHDNWFTVYRPWLQRGFEIGLGIISKQEGGEAE